MRSAKYITLLQAKTSSFIRSTTLRQRLIFGAVLGISVMSILVLQGRALTGTVYPNGDLVRGWTPTPTGCTTTTHYDCIDETSHSTADYVNTGTALQQVTEEYSMTSVAGSNVNITSVGVRLYANSVACNGNAPNCDTLSINVRIGGVLQTAQTVTLTTTNSLYTATFNGTWTSDSDLELVVTRNVVGGGNANNADDDVRMTGLDAVITYTNDANFAMSAYRWLTNANTVNSTYAKTWGGTGSDSLNAVTTSSDGGFVVAGTSSIRDTSNGDAFLAKYDTSGGLSWSNAWDVSPNTASRAQDVIQTSDGGYALVGAVTDGGAGAASDMLLVKFNGDGTLGWSKRWGGSGYDYGKSVIQSADGGYVVTGQTMSYGSGDEDMFLAKFSSDGTLGWSRTWGDIDTWETGHTVVQASDGGYTIAVDDYDDGTGENDIVLLKYDSSGTLSWSKKYDDGTGVTRQPAMVRATDGGYVVTAFSDTASGEILLMKFDSSGTLSWTKTWGGSSNDTPTSITNDTDGGYVVTGTTSSYGNGTGDVVLIKYDSSGNLSWNKTWGGTGNDNTNDVVQGVDGGYMVVANTNSYGTTTDFDGIALKFHSNGAMLNCSSPMCQTPSAGTSTVSTTSSSTSASTSSPSATTSSPSGALSTLTPSVSTVVATASNGADVGAPLAAQDTAITAPGTGVPIRLRLNLHVTNSQADPGKAFRLQYATRSGTCDTAHSGEVFDNVTTTTNLRYYDNSNLTDASTLATDSADPTHGADTLVRQTYEELNNFTIASAIAAGADGMWDFSLVFGSSASTGSYCLRVVDATSGTPLLTPTAVPEVTLAAPTHTQANYRLFANADSVTPGSPLAAQNTAASISTVTPFRLRQRLAVDTSNAAANGQNFKLQYAEKSGVCDTGFSGETFSDVYSTGTPQSVSMTSATRTVTEAENANGTRTWTGDANAVGSDNTYAVSSYAGLGGEGTEYLVISADMPTIPSNATITGIRMGVEGYYVGDVSSAARLALDGVLKGDEEFGVVNASGNEQLRYIGGSNSLWGTTWTAAEINSATNFQIYLTADLWDSLGTPYIYIDDAFAEVHYTIPVSNPLSYSNNASVADGAAISSIANDPINNARSTVFQTYRETDPFSFPTAIVSGSDGLWDFALNSSSAAAGKTYCLRVVKSDGSLLGSYSQIPEVSFNSATGPTLDQKLRGGQGVINGTKFPFDL